MPSASELAIELFQRGEFKKLIDTLGVQAHEWRRLGDHELILLAHALALGGEIERAERALGTVAITGTARSLRSKAYVASGIIREGLGDGPKAYDSFNLAVLAAQGSSDKVQAAWAQLRLFRHVIDRGTRAEAAGLLSITRRASTNAGTPQVIAYLHQCVGVLEGHAGRLAEARRHFDIADELEAKDPNAWIRSGTFVNRACVAIADADFGRATSYLRTAREIAVENGIRTSAIDTNLAHCEIVGGQFARAHRTLGRVLASPRTSHLARLGVLEENARLHLAESNLSECQHALEKIDAEITRDPRLKDTFHARWASITRARFLARKGRLTDAIALLRQAEDEVANSDDVKFMASLRLSLAWCMGLRGDTQGALTQLMQSLRWGLAGCHDIQALYYFTFSRLFRHDSRVEASLTARALHLWKHQQVVSTPLELIGNAHCLSHSLVVESSASPDKSWSPDALCSVASLLEPSHSPALVAEELKNLIVDVGLNAKESGRSRATIPWVLEVAGDELLFRIDDRVISCSMPSTPEAAVRLGALTQIFFSAAALRRAKEQERRQTALWPAEQTDEQSDALFIAEEMQRLLADARRVAATNVSVLITGETGTGKEILARTIHACSPRARAVFLPFNCTSTPKDMLDSQLFGHRRGAFTGATEHFQGVIRAAAGGTLFLDEIGDMGLDVQPKLLRFLDAGEVHPVGETHPHPVDVRVIAATNVDLDRLVAEGRFRDDLFYRLNIVHLHVPALRERRVEIPALANHFLQKFAQEYGRGDLRFAEETMEYLVLFNWPGNVRQLAGEIRRMAALAETGAILMPEHLSTALAASRRTIPPSERVLAPTEIVVRIDQPMAAATHHLERAMIQYAMGKTGGRVEEAAALLGLSRKGLYLKRVRFGIDAPDTAPVAGVA